LLNLKKIDWYQWRIQKMVLGGGEGGLWAVPPAGVQEAELPLGVWGRSPPEAGVLMHSV